MVEWESPRHCEHQTMKARQTVGAIGQGKVFLESASKQAKVTNRNILVLILNIMTVRSEQRIEFLPV
jgi:hypothetical protein